MAATRRRRRRSRRSNRDREREGGGAEAPSPPSAWFYDDLLTGLPWPARQLFRCELATPRNSFFNPLAIVLTRHRCFPTELSPDDDGSPAAGLHSSNRPSAR